MMEDKPPCPVHGVRPMRRGHGGGNRQFGRWFHCGICGFKRWIQQPDNVNLMLAIIFASYWAGLIARAVF